MPGLATGGRPSIARTASSAIAAPSASTASRAEPSVTRSPAGRAASRAVLGARPVQLRSSISTPPPSCGTPTILRSPRKLVWQASVGSGSPRCPRARGSSARLPPSATPSPPLSRAACLTYSSNIPPMASSLAASSPHALSSCSPLALSVAVPRVARLSKWALRLCGVHLRLRATASSRASALFGAAPRACAVVHVSPPSQSRHRILYSHPPKQPGALLAPSTAVYSHCSTPTRTPRPPPSAPSRGRPCATMCAFHLCTCCALPAPPASASIPS